MDDVSSGTMTVEAAEPGVHPDGRDAPGEGAPDALSWPEPAEPAELPEGGAAWA